MMVFQQVANGSSPLEVSDLSHRKSHTIIIIVKKNSKVVSTIDKQNPTS